MKTILFGAWALALTLAGAGVAADKATQNASKEVTQDTKTTTTNGTTKVSTDTVYGKVESLDPGKSFTVSVPGKLSSTKSFDLNSKDETVNSPSDLKVGDWVRVQEKTDNNGHKNLMVQHSTEGAANRASRVKR
jgi:hypothetical protein